MILVTGATGFLGRYVAEQHVARGDRVRVLVRRECPDLARLGIDQRIGDLRDEAAVVAACEGVDTVQHVAGVAGIWGPWDHFHGINTQGTLNIIAGCRRHGVRKLVYTSSPSVTFDGVAQSGIDESAPYPTRWLCHYPHTKALGEQAVLAANGRDGLLTCALRPHLIWGPRDRHLIPRLIDRARRGRLRRVGDGRNIVDTVYVENAAQAQLQAADALVAGSPVAGQAYFITQGEPVNCWEWIDRLLALHGQPPVRKSMSFRAAWTAGRVFEGIYSLLGLKSEPLMTRFLAAQLALDHYFDIGKARRDFGYEPRVSTEEGLRRLSACQPGVK
ncbi:MAG TPA: NAD-dependent epimerase/dehydratase family protein [Pirellulaceae bacterium]|nr:NAD-dependent epimerase/dehydratase family protein [Pirellulaceae bacterium]